MWAAQAWFAPSGIHPSLGTCYGLNCVSQNPYAEVLTPSPSKYDLIWRQGPHRGNQVKRRAIGRPLIQVDWCPLWKGDIWTQTHPEGRQCEALAVYKPRREAWTATSRTALPTPRFPTFSLQNCETAYFCCSSHAVCGTSLQPQHTNTLSNTRHAEWGALGLRTRNRKQDWLKPKRGVCAYPHRNCFSFCGFSLIPKHLSTVIRTLLCPYGLDVVSLQR